MKPPVEAPASRARRSGDGDREPLQCGLELVAASADEGRGGPEQDDGLVRGDEARRLLGLRARDEDGAGGDGRLGLLPGFDEAASHELGIEPAAGPAGQLAAFLVAELLASETFLPCDLPCDLPVTCVRVRLGRARRRLDAREAGRGDRGGGVAGPGGRLAGLHGDVLGGLAGLGRHTLGGLARLVGRILGRLAGLAVTSLVALRPALADFPGPRPPGWRATPTTWGRSSPAGWPPRGAPVRAPARWTCGFVRPSCPPNPVPGCAGCLRRSPILARSPRPGHG